MCGQIVSIVAEVAFVCVVFLKIIFLIVSMVVAWRSQLSLGHRRRDSACGVTSLICEML
jgi:hypothetical protein